MDTLTTLDELLKFQKDLYSYAKRHGCSEEDAKDVSCFGVMQVWLGEIPNFKYRLADYYRDLWGREVDARPRFVHDIIRKSGKIEPISEYLPDTKSHIGNTYQLEYYKEYLTFDQIEILRLKSFGFDDREIMKKFGRTNDWLKNRLREIEDVLNAVESLAQ